MTNKKKPARKCKHCLVNKGLAGRRGLCTACHANLDIRKLYGRLDNRAKVLPVDDDNDDGGDMTMEEIEKMIAEQYPTMPGRINDPDHPHYLERDKQGRIGENIVKVRGGKRTSKPSREGG